MKQKKPHTEKTVFAEATDSAPVYYECPACGYISGDPHFLDLEHPCPHCKATGKARRTFPTDRIRRLDERIRTYERQGDSEVVVILVMAFLEAVLEDVLDRIMEFHGADIRLRRTVMDTQRSIGVRIGKVFPTLAGEEFEDAASELGYRDFPKRWRKMREARNGFIHDSPFNGPQETLNPQMAAEAMELLDQAYRLFVLLNNRFVADGVHKE